VISNKQWNKTTAERLGSGQSFFDQFQTLSLEYFWCIIFPKCMMQIIHFAFLQYLKRKNLISLLIIYISKGNIFRNDYFIINFAPSKIDAKWVYTDARDVKSDRLLKKEINRHCKITQAFNVWKSH